MSIQKRILPKVYIILIIMMIFLFYYSCVYESVGSVDIPVALTGTPEVSIGMTEENFIALNRETSSRLPTSESGFIYTEQQGEYVFEYYFRSYFGQSVLYDFIVNINDDKFPEDSIPSKYLFHAQRLFKLIEKSLGDEYQIGYYEIDSQVRISWNLMNTCIRINTPFNTNCDIIQEDDLGRKYPFTFLTMPASFVSGACKELTLCSADEAKKIKEMLKK